MNMVVELCYKVDSALKDSGVFMPAWPWFVCISAKLGTSGARQQRLMSYLDPLAVSDEYHGP